MSHLGVGQALYNDSFTQRAAQCGGHGASPLPHTDGWCIQPYLTLSDSAFSAASHPSYGALTSTPHSTDGAFISTSQVGMVSVVMNLYLRNFHYWITALQPKVLQLA